MEESPSLEGTPLRHGVLHKAVVALSSGQAEYYCIVKGAFSVGVQSLLKDMGTDATIHMYTDSSVAKGSVNESSISVDIIAGIHNQADIFTCCCKLL